MADNPLTPHEISIHRDRILVEIAKIRQGDDFSVDQDKVEELFNKTAFVSNKANVLAKALAEAAEKFFIPVSPDAEDVVAAVKRKSADSPDGSQISFDLFRDAVDYSQKSKQEIQEVVLQNVTYQPHQALSKAVRKIKANLALIQSGIDSGDISEELLEMLVSQFLILYLTHELMKPFEGIDHIAITATMVQTGDTELVILGQILLGVIIQLLIMGINEALLESFLDDSALFTLPKGKKGRDLINEAKSLPPTKSQQMAQLYRGINDYELILKYSFDFLARTTEIGYDMWVGYVDAVQYRNIAQSMWVYAPHYSVAHAIAGQRFIPHNKHNRTRSKDEDNPIDRIKDSVGDTLKTVVAEGIVPMGEDSYLARLNALDGMSDGMDRIAQVLSSDFTKAVVCCLGAFVKKLPPHTLELLKGVLHGLKSAQMFDFGKVINAIHDLLVGPSFLELIALDAMFLIERFFDKVFNRLAGLFNADMDALICCPLIGEMIDEILGFLIRLETELKNAVKQFTFQLKSSLGLGSAHLQLRYEKVYRCRTLEKMIKIIDLAIKAAETFEDCSKPENDPGFQSIRSATLLPTINISDDDKKNYFSTAVDRVLDNGKFLPALGKEIEHLEADPLESAKAALRNNKCCQPEDVDKVIDNFSGNQDENS